MHESLLLTVPLVVLTIVLLFGFVGCSSFSEDMSGATGVDYPSTIQAEASLVAYWRLQEPATTAIAPPPPGGIAVDEKGAHPGRYARFSPAPNKDTKRLSAANPGVINLGITPGLLGHEPAATCVAFNGGLVTVDFDPALNTPKFTVEAWVVPEFDGFPQGTYWCLFENGAPANGKQKTQGFALYIGPESPTNLNTPYEWQVWMGDGTTFQKVVNTQATPALVTFNKTTYLALTFDGNRVVLYVYLPETGQELTIASVAPLIGTFSGFQPATTGKFVIGAGRNLVPTSPSTANLYAFNGKMQDVALYSDALLLETSLVAHQQAGGPF